MHDPNAPMRMSQQVIPQTEGKLIAFELITSKYNRETNQREECKPFVLCKLQLPDASVAFIRLYMSPAALQYSDQKAELLGIKPFFDNAKAVLAGGGTTVGCYSKPSTYRQGAVDWELSNPSMQTPRAQQQDAGFTPPQASAPAPQQQAPAPERPRVANEVQGSWQPSNPQPNGIQAQGYAPPATQAPVNPAGQFQGGTPQSIENEDPMQSVPF